MNTFTVANTTVSVEIDDTKMESFGIPSFIPSCVVDKATQENTAGAVYVTSSFFELSRAAQRALLCHEVGHVACGHLELEETQTTDLVINARLEAEADAFAVRHYGEAMFDASMRECATMVVRNLIASGHALAASELTTAVYAEVTQRKANRIALAA